MFCCRVNDLAETYPIPSDIYMSIGFLLPVTCCSAAAYLYECKGGIHVFNSEAVIKIEG